jgi:hypothetical protein
MIALSEFQSGHLTLCPTAAIKKGLTRSGMAGSNPSRF